MTNLKVSIIIPVYNEEQILSLCLDSLMKLNYPKELLEIIIIDNNSRDSSASIIKKYPVKYMFEAQKGRSIARNTAIKAASGEIIAFTDADCIVGKQWLKSLVRGFTAKNIGCCGGRILSYKPANWIEQSFYWLQKNQYKSLEYSDSENYFTEPLFATCNLACRREVIDKIGLFDTTFEAGEDTDFLWRANLAGFQLKHVRDAVVFHKHRDKIQQLPEVFWGYMYWQFWLIQKYKNIIGLSFNWFKITKDVFFNIIYSFLGLFKKPKGLPIYYIFKSIFSLMGILAGIYGAIEIAAGKGKKFPELIFKPLKTLWRWDKDGNVKMIDLDKQLYYHLSGIGAQIWELYIANKSEEDIFAAISVKEVNCDTIELKNNINILFAEFLNEGIFPNSTEA